MLSADQVVLVDGRDAHGDVVFSFGERTRIENRVVLVQEKVSEVPYVLHAVHRPEDGHEAVITSVANAASWD